MNYRHTYMLIISRAKIEQSKGLRPVKRGSKEFSNQHFEFHHILPKSLFPNWVNRKSNIVPLTAREHYFCHQLLTKIFDCSETKTALWFMSSSGRWKCTSKDYQRSKMLLVENMKGHKRNLGRKDSEIQKVRKSEGRKKFLKQRGEYHLFTNGIITVQAANCPGGFYPGRSYKDKEAFCKRARDSHIGMKWWTDGVRNVQSKVKPGDSFKPGRLNLLTEKSVESIRLKLKKLNQEKPSTWYNNGTRNFRIRKGDVIPEGLIKGRLPNYQKS